MFVGIGFILNIITLSISVLSCVISSMILIVIICHLHHNRLKQEDRVTIILCTNIYLFLLIVIITLLSFNIQTLIGDLHDQNFNSASCIPSGYLFSVCLGVLYWGFVNQALFRLCRVVYSTHRWLQLSWLYIIIPSIELIIISILFCPVLVLNGVTYLPEEYYCFANFLDFRVMLCFLFNIYGTPLSFLSLIYLRITLFLRRQSNNQILRVRRRQQRDAVVIRRILITVSLLIALGMPALGFLLFFYITGIESPLFHRILFLGASLSMIGLSLSMAISTRQLKSLILKTFVRQRIAPIHISIAGLPPQRPL